MLSTPERSCNYPFLSWKNTVQQGLPISFNPAVVYRGLPMACLNLGGTTAVQFGTTGFFTKQLAASVGTGDMATVGGAFLGGLASGIPCSIWELCMIQQQRFGGSLLSTPATFIKEFGFGSLTRGFTTTMGRESMFTMAMLGITPLIQTKLVENSGMEKNSALAAGALTGACFAGTITHPMDTIKTCMQGDLGRVKYVRAHPRLASEAHAPYLPPCCYRGKRVTRGVGGTAAQRGTGTAEHAYLAAPRRMHLTASHSLPDTSCTPDVTC